MSEITAPTNKFKINEPIENGAALTLAKSLNILRFSGIIVIFILKIYFYKKP